MRNFSFLLRLVCVILMLMLCATIVACTATPNEGTDTSLQTVGEIEASTATNPSETSVVTEAGVDTEVMTQAEEQTSAETSADSQAGKEPAADTQAETQPTTQAPEETQPEPVDDFEPVVRFAVVSDIHFATTRDEEAAKQIELLYKTAYAYSNSHSTYKNLDAVLYAGDIADRGTDWEFQTFYAAVNKHTKAGTQNIVGLGNHEYNDNAQLAESRFIAAGGQESINTHTVINGYHVIVISPDLQNGWRYSTSLLNWLDAELQKAVADDPTGVKPVFVAHHVGATDTVYGTEGSGDPNIGAVFCKYPQVVSFSGHSHRPLSDQASLWQGEYTALGTGGMYHFCHTFEDGREIYANGNTGGWSDSYIGPDGGQYYIIEVNAKNEIRILRYDVIADTFLYSTVLGSVGDPEKFDYKTAELKENSELPAFPQDAVIVPVKLNKRTASFTFPQATTTAGVRYYRCEVYQEGALVTTVYRMSDSHLQPTPAELELPVSGLERNTDYVLKIIPVNSYGREGEPLTLEFSTAP